MADRRACQARGRRSAHKSMRRKGVIDQTYMSSQQGPSGSPKAQAPQRAQRARRA